jgi:phosphoserine aminotransferase
MPVSVLEKAASEMTAMPGIGISVMEMSHRSPPYQEIHAAAQANLRSLLGVPDNYQVLFLQGGSRLQFSMVPMNFLRGAKAPADYVLTGAWGKKAADEARREGDVNVAFDAGETNYDRLPGDGFKLNPDAPYVHVTSNETIEGVQFSADPLGDADVGTPLVADLSSDFLCRPLPIEKYGLIYACAQKNAGPAGLTIVLIRDDLLAHGSDDLPGYMNYRSHAEADSMWNTPPTFAIYMFNLICGWLADEIGGLEKMQQQNQAKAATLYGVVDESAGFYRPHAQTDCRSLMNVTFRLPSDELQSRFLSEATEQKLTNLKGHRSVGGIRASIYNAQPVEGVNALASFMKDFANANG